MTTIIIPTYNRFQLLKQAVESCLNQTYKNIEIIIIDDGSTDGTEKKVNELLVAKWKNKCVSYYKQKNAGASEARNFGLEKANGEFIQFLDSDDLLFPNKIKNQLKSIKANNADACSSYGVMGAETSKNNVKLGVGFNSKTDLLHKLCSGKVHVMPTPAPLWRKSILELTSGWNKNLSLGDDLEYHVRVLLGVKKINFLPEELFYVREHEQNRLSDFFQNIKKIESSIQTQKIITNVLVNIGLWDAIFQEGILKVSKTLYINYMQLASLNSLKHFEDWLLNIANSPKYNLKLIILIKLRRIIGTKLFSDIYKLISKIS